MSFRLRLPLEAESGLREIGVFVVELLFVNGAIFSLCALMDVYIHGGICVNTYLQQFDSPARVLVRHFERY